MCVTSSVLKGGEVGGSGRRSSGKTWKPLCSKCSRFKGDCLVGGRREEGGVGGGSVGTRLEVENTAVASRRRNLGWNSIPFNCVR